MAKIKIYSGISLYNFGKDKLYCKRNDGIYECIPIETKYDERDSDGLVKVRLCNGEIWATPHNIYASLEDAVRGVPYSASKIKMKDLFSDWRFGADGLLRGFYISGAEIGYQDCSANITADAEGVHIDFQCSQQDRSYYKTRDDAEAKLTKSVKVVNLDGDVSYGVEGQPRKTRTIDVSIKVFED